MTDKIFVNISPELNYQKIDTIWTFLSEDEGGEGIVAQLINGAWMSFVTGEERVVKKLIPLAKNISMHSGKKVKLVKFTKREDLEVIKWD